MSQLLEKAREYEQNNVKNIPNAQRPVFHFSVPSGWLNDPNGFSDFKEEHHLFFQYNPYSTHWDSMHWGHAKSTDFIKWKYLPAALAPDKEYDNAGVFSGSALEDGEKQILLYTGVKEELLENGEKQIRQTQCLAIGDGINYEKFPANPVITDKHLPAGSSKEDFRDPKIWKEGERYYAVIGSRSPDGSGQILLFFSDNLTDWQFGNILDKCENKLGKMWECPDFFHLNNYSVLMVSPQDMLAEGLTFHNGNNALFLIGDYQKETFQFTRKHVQNIDYGLDFYAPQTMLTGDGRRIMTAWMQSWDTYLCPEDYLWYGMMICPRELSIKNGTVYQTPVHELTQYYTEKVSYSNLPIGQETPLKGIEGRIIDLQITLKSGDYQKFKIKLASNQQFYSEIIYNREEGILTFDRSHSGYRRDIVSTRSMIVEEENNAFHMRILMDRYSVEIFVNYGKQVMTSLIYTPQSATGITFESIGEALMDITKYNIEV